MSGALTPTEVSRHGRLGGCGQLFLCRNVGGPTYVRELKGSFPRVDVVVTGGVTLDNCEKFFTAGASAVGVGNVIFEPEALQTGKAEAISANARRFVEAVRGYQRK